MKSSPIVIAALFSVAAAIRMHDDDGSINLNQSLIDSNADIGMQGYEEVADNSQDKEMKTSSFAQVSRDIIDADGDGVEDNKHKTQDELDRFRTKVFGVAVEDMHNTQNGGFPGHVRAGDSPMPTLTATQVQAAV